MISRLDDLDDLVCTGDQEYERLQEKAREFIRENLDDYVVKNSIVTKRGSKTVEIPMVGIRIPSFVHDEKKQGGVGKAVESEDDGDTPGQGSSSAESKEAEHTYSVEVEVDKIMDIIEEQLALPRLEKRAKKDLSSQDIEFNDLRRRGSSLLDKKRTIKNAYLRTARTGSSFRIEPDDQVFRTWTSRTQKDSSAVIFAIMDVSGSVSNEQKHLVRSTLYWLEQWLKRQYGSSIEIVYIVHDKKAHEVSSNEFFTIQENGGTCISSGLDLCLKIAASRYGNGSDTNIYPFFFSDGDNEADDNEKALDLLEQLIDISNQVCYGEVSGSGSFCDVSQKFNKNSKYCYYTIKSRNDIIPALKKFLGPKK